MLNISKEPLVLTWGNARFLQPYWEKHGGRLPSERLFAGDYIYGSEKFLQLGIKLLHKDQQNADTNGKCVVIGNGASQIINGLIHILNIPVYAIPPYFSRFPIFADNARVPWDMGKEYLQIVTSPNNPDGKIQTPYSDKYILDACYNWKQYTDPYLASAPIMVFSLSKATGHCSTRIGWALLDDYNLANELERYIEHTTAGVSEEAQGKAFEIIMDQYKTSNTVFDYGRNILDNRWKILHSLEPKLPVKYLSHKGMFLYVDKGTYFKVREIEGMDGNNFGDNPSHYRMNIGCSSKEFAEFIERIKP